MKQDFSPEERLLNLIRGNKRQKRPEPKKENRGVPDAGRAHLARAELNREASPKSHRQSGKSKRFSIAKFVNQLLFAFLLFLAIFLLVDYIIPHPQPIALKIAEPEIMDKSSEEKPLLDFPPYSYYAKDINSRELFKPLIGPDEEGEEIKKVTLKERTVHLSLIGVVGGEIPEAIIEDKKANKTYFLNQGDSIGEIKIKQILEGKVLLTYEGEELTLVL